MRVKILQISDNKVTGYADRCLLTDKGFLVITTYDLLNVNELIEEIRPDLVFFNPTKQGEDIVEAYNNMMNSIEHANIPVIFTLSENSCYLVSPKRTGDWNKKTTIADNILDAIKMARQSNTLQGAASAKINIAIIKMPVEHQIMGRK